MQKINRGITMKHTHEEFKPLTIFNSIFELFDFCFVKLKFTDGSLVHRFCQIQT